MLVTGPLQNFKLKHCHKINPQTFSATAFCVNTEPLFNFPFPSLARSVCSVQFSGGGQFAAVLESAASWRDKPNYQQLYRPWIFIQAQTINNLHIYTTIYVYSMRAEASWTRAGTMRGISTSLMLVVVAPAIITGGEKYLIWWYKNICSSDDQKGSRSPGTATWATTWRGWATCRTAHPSTSPPSQGSVAYWIEFPNF